MTVTTPFEDSKDAFVSEIKTSGLTINISAMTHPTNITLIPPTDPSVADNPQQPTTTNNTNSTNYSTNQTQSNPNASTIPRQEKDWVHQMNISGDDSFTTRASNVVSHADDAIANTDGASSFNPDPINTQCNLC